MGTIRFEIRKDKIDKDGEVPIRVVYQVRGQRKYYNTGKKIPPGNWSEDDQRGIYVKKGPLLELDVKKLNAALSKLEASITEIEDKFTANKQRYDAGMVIEELTHGSGTLEMKSAHRKEVFAFIDKYLEDHRRSRKPGSMTVYRSLRRHLEGYEKKSRSKVRFENIDAEFFRRFQNYLFDLKKKDKQGGESPALNNITVAKQLSTLKTFLNYAREHDDIVVSDKYRSFKIKKDTDLEVIALTRDEFDKIYNLDLSARPALAQVRDVFCFSCVTGLRYSDLKQLRREHITTDFIDLTAVKTGYKTKVPVNVYSRAIIDRYKGDPRVLPIISNQKSNEQLAKICEMAGIDTPVEIVRKFGSNRKPEIYPKYDLIRMHCGRKTFATLSLESGMSAEHVMKIGGWKDYKSFKRYINITDDSSKAAMAKAWGAVKTNLKAI